MKRTQSETDTADAMERRELIAMLRTQIDNLPELERTLLACCFGASMSHRKIADVVGIPDRTVTHKINQILARLRTSLGKASVAAAIPMLAQDHILEAMTTGLPCPTGMGEKLLKGIQNHEHGIGANAAHSRRVAAIKWGGACILPAFIVTVLAGAGIAYGLLRSHETVAPSEAALPRVKPDSSSVNDVPSFYSRWTFEKGAAPGLEIFQGSWTWKKLANASGCMTPDTAEPVIVKIPGRFPAQPVKATINVNLDQTGDVQVKFLWMSGQNVVPHREWRKYIAVKEKIPPVHVTFTAYFIDRHIVVLWNGEVNQIHESQDPYPSRELAVAFQRVNVEDIELHALPAGEIPQAVRDIPQLIEAMNVKPTIHNEHNELIELPAAKK